MLGKIRIEIGAASYAGCVMLHRLLQGGEPAVVHVGARDRNIAQRRHGELAPVSCPPADGKPAGILGGLIQPVVGEILTLEKRPAMAMEAVGAELPPPRIVFRLKQLETPLLPLGEFAF